MEDQRCRENEGGSWGEIGLKASLHGLVLFWYGLYIRSLTMYVNVTHDLGEGKSSERGMRSD